MSSSATEHQQQILYQTTQSQSTETESPQNQQHQGNLQYSLSQISIQESWALGNQATIAKENSAITNSLVQGEWLNPTSAQLIGYHDCRSLAFAWGLGISETTSLDGPTGASQAQSPSEDDCGDGKSNELLASCPAFRNELSNEPIRRVALSRHQQQMPIFSKWSSDDWHREHIAAEIGVLEDVSNVYLGGKLCAERQPKIVVEPQDMGSYYFRHCFVGRPHVEYCGNDESLGPVVISMVREEIKDGSCQHIIYRLIIRISDILTMRVAIPEEALSDNSQDRSTRNLMRELLEIICPQVHFGSLRPAINIPKVEEMLLKIDEQPIYRKYKVGVLYCKARQQTEEQMYNNENSSPNFEEFLDFLGMRVRLKGFEGYKGGLDTKSDTTGQYSIYTEHHNSAQIMFHVSTLLPFTPNNKQQLARKRHIGNDMVTIIFQEPESLPFSPITVRSHFQHVFIIIQCCNPLTEKLAYKVAISRAKDVPAFGPPLSSALYQKNAEFHDFLIHKIINAENAVLRSRKFASMAARTRREALKDMVENYSATHHTNEGASRIASRLLGGSSIKKSKERIIPKPMLDSSLRAALSWQVEFFDHSFGRKTAGVLGLSADNLVLLDVPSGLCIFSCPTHSILGWIQIADGGLKIFYDHFNMLLLWCISPDGSERELGFLLKRLVAVTNGDEAKEVILRKSKPSESYFGFNMQEEGIVTEVDMNKSAWRQGIRQGSRILELESKALIQYRAEQISELLIEKIQLKVTMLSPGSDGNPRRGCEDPSCPAIKGLECKPVLTPDIFSRHSTYLNTQSTDQEKHFRQKRQMPPRIFAPSDSWSGSHSNATILSAISEQKKHSAPAFGQQKHLEGSLAKSSFDSIGYNDLGQQQYILRDDQQGDNGRQLFNRACSDDASSTLSITDPSKDSLEQGPSLEETLLLHSMTTQAASSIAPLSHPVQEVLFEAADGQQQIDHGKCKWWLQKTLKEKKDLEADLQTVKAQLANEQRLHEITKRNLSIMTEYCQRFTIIPPAFEEEEDEEL